MKCCPGNLAKAIPPFLSIAVIALCAWAWHRSQDAADYFYRLSPVRAGGTVMRGVASSGGALLFGSLYNPNSVEEPSAFTHSVQPRIPSGGGGSGSILSMHPSYKVAALGFGVSRGELRFNLPPLSFMVPPRAYSVLYVPYYFIMLLAAMPLARLAWRLARRGAAPGEAVTQPEPSPA
jgi:hypothetical protein